MQASSFAAVARLSPSEQRRLLESGDGPERLWSAWAIALRLGRDAIPLLQPMEGAQVPEGLRRQLLIVLAGLGERQLLKTLADSEPSPSVQATASVLYLRTAPDPASAETIAFALQQLRKAPAEVRRAILAEQELGQAAIPTRELLPTLRDSDVATRIACLRCVLKDPSSGEHVDAVRAAVDAYADEDDASVRREFLGRLPRSSVPELLRIVAERDASRLLESLQAMLGQFEQLTWQDVSDIAPAATLEVSHTILIAGIQPEPPDGVLWLCGVIKRTSGADLPLARDLNWRALHAIRPVLSEETVALLEAADRALLRARFEKELAEHAHDIESYGPDSDEEGCGGELERLVHLLG